MHLAHALQNVYAHRNIQDALDEMWLRCGCKQDKLNQTAVLSRPVDLNVGFETAASLCVLILVTAQHGSDGAL